MMREKGFVATLSSPRIVGTHLDQSLLWVTFCSPYKIFSCTFLVLLYWVLVQLAKTAYGSTMLAGNILIHILIGIRCSNGHTIIAASYPTQDAIVIYSKIIGSWGLLGFGDVIQKLGKITFKNSKGFWRFDFSGKMLKREGPLVKNESYFRVERCLCLGLYAGILHLSPNLGVS